MGMEAIYEDVKQKYNTPDKIDAYWQEWLNCPEPLLENQTPREIAQSPAGKTLLESILDLYSKELGHHFPPYFPSNMATIRALLGLSEQKLH